MLLKILLVLVLTVVGSVVGGGIVGIPTLVLATGVVLYITHSHKHPTIK